MSAQVFEVHETNPQLRLIKNVAEVLDHGGVAVYPTDSCYALGCEVGNKKALEKVRLIRQLPHTHNLTLAVRDLKEISRYARVSDMAFRTIKRLSPGPYTFILEATREVPRILHHPKRKTIGLRVPNHPATRALLQEMDAPLLTTSLILPDNEWVLGDPDEIKERTSKLVDAILLAGWGGNIPTTVVDLTGDDLVVIREGLGEL